MEFPLVGSSMLHLSNRLYIARLGWSFFLQFPDRLHIDCFVVQFNGLAGRLVTLYTYCTVLANNRAVHTVQVESRKKEKR